MSILITLRTSASKSHFKQHVISLMAYPQLTQILICSGYFQEGTKYSVSHDDIIDTILKNPNLANIEVLIIGGQFKNFKPGKSEWHKQFDLFLKELKGSGIRHKGYIIKNKNWHAKVILGLEQQKPIIGISGSSNLTRPAYSEPYPWFNYECDVTIISNGSKIIDSFNSRDDLSIQDPLSPIITILDESFPQPDEDARLNGLYGEIFDQEDLEEYSDY